MTGKILERRYGELFFDVVTNNRYSERLEDVQASDLESQKARISRLMAVSGISARNDKEK